MQTPGSTTKRTGSAAVLRSEEHTSELQSRLHLVCRLLLEKKKKEPYADRTGPIRYPYCLCRAISAEGGGSFCHVVRQIACSVLPSDDSRNGTPSARFATS